MAVLQITSKEFKDNPNSIFELADKGEQIIIKRGKKRSYTLTPITDEHTELPHALIEKIEHSLRNIKEGKTKRYSMEELRIKMGL